MGEVETRSLWWPEFWGRVFFMMRPTQRKMELKLEKKMCNIDDII